METVRQKLTASRLTASGRTVLYILGLGFAVVLDAATPLGVADWLIELVFVWAAATWGGTTEMVLVAAASTATMLAGLWSSPAESVSFFFVGALNRAVAVGVIWAIVHVARKERIAEAERAKAAAEIKVIAGLLPICAGCKAIRAAGGDWHNLETYLTDHSEATLSHTYCPECFKKYFPELAASTPAPR